MCEFLCTKSIKKLKKDTSHNMLLTRSLVYNLDRYCSDGRGYLKVKNGQVEHCIYNPLLEQNSSFESILTNNNFLREDYDALFLHARFATMNRHDFTCIQPKLTGKIVSLFKGSIYNVEVINQKYGYDCENDVELVNKMIEENTLHDLVTKDIIEGQITVVYSDIDSNEITVIHKESTIKSSYTADVYYTVLDNSFVIGTSEDNLILGKFLAGSNYKIVQIPHNSIIRFNIEDGVKGTILWEKPKDINQEIINKDLVMSERIVEKDLKYYLNSELIHTFAKDIVYPLVVSSRGRVLDAELGTDGFINYYSKDVFICTEEETDKYVKLYFVYGHLCSTPKNAYLLLNKFNHSMSNSNYLKAANSHYPIYEKGIVTATVSTEDLEVTPMFSYYLYKFENGKIKSRATRKALQAMADWQKEMNIITTKQLNETNFQLPKKKQV